MSFFNKMRSFPEWHNSADALDDAIKCEKKLYEVEAIANGPSYVEFVRKQPEDINDILFRINDKIKELDTQKKNSVNALVQLRKDFETLRPANDDIKNKRKQYQKIVEIAEKSKAAADKAEQRLEATRAKGTGTPELKKAEDAFDIAVRQKQVDIANLEEGTRQNEENNRQYKKKMFTLILQSLSSFAASRGSSYAGRVQNGDQLAEYGNQIPFYEDNTVNKLQNKLQSIRAEPLE